MIGTYFEVPNSTFSVIPWHVFVEKSRKIEKKYNHVFLKYHSTGLKNGFNVLIQGLQRIIIS
jgi:hypothetical protein